jgi:DNA modification methylase
MGELSKAEQDDPARCEAVVERGLATFVEVGVALMMIRGRKLYREQFTSFEDYCRSKWGMSRIRAHQLIGASSVAANVLTTVNTPLANERQARSLAPLDPDQQRPAWAHAVETSNGKPTGEHVRQAVAEMFSKGEAADRGSASSDRPGNDGVEVPEGTGSATGSSSRRSDGAAAEVLGIRGSTASHRIIPGDARKVLPTLASESVQCCPTSPPYFRQRDYDHPDQVGRERTPKEYIANLVGVFREVKRILRPDGIVFLNLGDKHHRGSLLGIPDRVARAFRRDGWIWRDRVVWAKAVMKGDQLKGHCMPGSQRNRCTTSHEVILMFTKSRRYYYDIHGERSASGATLRSVWEIGIQSNPGGHFALMPVRLAERCIRLATSEKGVCPVCLTPWRRVVEREQFATRTGVSSGVNRASSHEDSPYHGHRGRTIGNRDPLRRASRYRTVGWEPGCECGLDETSPCVVLDPFAGLSTTAVAASLLGRSSIMVELNGDYCEAGRRRFEEMSP